MKHRQEILLSRERSHLPQLQIFAERELKARKYDNEAHGVRQKISVLTAEYNKQLEILNRLLVRSQNNAWRVRNNRRINEEEAADNRGGAVAPVVDAEGAERAENKKFIRRCTATGCNGFLSSVWKCGLCSNWVCPECFEVKGQNKDTPHTCKPENIETAKLIRKDTKPCPSCGEMIMKQEGCDQMWCISCHTPFSWQTGNIITSGVIHNPHYYQWLAKNGGHVPRNAGDIPCGGMPDIYRIRRSFRNVPQVDLQELTHIHRMCSHIIDIDRRDYEVHLRPANNEDIGIRFLLNEIAEEDWKRALASREKTRQKSKEIRDILDAFNGASIDIFRRIELQTEYTRNDGIQLICDMIHELNALREFTMDAMDKVGVSFNCSVPALDEEWKLTRRNPIITERRKRAEKAKEADE